MIAKCSSCSTSLGKRSFVAAVTDRGGAAEEGDAASADWMSVLSEVNPTLVDELDVDGVEWAVEVVPVQSAQATGDGGLDETCVWFRFCLSNVWCRNNRSYCGQLI